MKEVRQKSNKGNIIMLFIGGFFFMGGIIEALLTILVVKREWPGNWIDLLSFILCYGGGILALVSAIRIKDIIEINKDLKDLAYGIDYQKELSTYSIIGRKDKKARNGAISFNKYSEWIEYVKNEFSEIVNCENAYRFMMRRLRNIENYKELLLFASVPIEVGTITILYSAGIGISGLSAIVSIIVSSVFITKLLVDSYYKCVEEICFINDFAEIVFPSIVITQK